MERIEWGIACLEYIVTAGCIQYVFVLHSLRLLNIFKMICSKPGNSPLIQVIMLTKIHIHMFEIYFRTPRGHTSNTSARMVRYVHHWVQRPLRTCIHKEPGYQQPRYWPSSVMIRNVLHVSTNTIESVIGVNNYIHAKSGLWLLIQTLTPTTVWLKRRWIFGMDY